MSQLNFDASSVSPQQSFTPLPAGIYTVAVLESEVKPTKSGTGQIAAFTLQVVDGEHRGRKLFARINVQNQNPEAERIGQSQLSSLCHAAGVLRLTDTAQLHGKVVRAKVKIRRDEVYGDSNEVTNFEQPGPDIPVVPAAATAPASAPPWQKRVA